MAQENLREDISGVTDMQKYRTRKKNKVPVDVPQKDPVDVLNEVTYHILMVVRALRGAPH